MGCDIIGMIRIGYTNRYVMIGLKNFCGAADLAGIRKNRWCVLHRILAWVHWVEM